MKVLLLNGSHHQNGNTALALEEAAKALEAEGVETELFQIGSGAIQYCIDCGKCTEKGCIFTGDPVNAFIAKAKEAGVVMTGAGATYPYKKDPHDSNIRIAPSFPPIDELVQATELFVLCVKLVSVDKLLENM